MKNSMRNLLKEDRLFSANNDFKANAHVKDRSLFLLAEQDYLEYWQQEAENLHWFNKWDQAVKWSPPYTQWFVNGKTNVSYNCLDRHMPQLKDKVAFFWRGESESDELSYTYGDMYERVQECANGLKKLGIKKGDRVAIYMPMIVEAVIAMQACARIGAISTVVFAGFSSQALADRINDAQCSLVITANGASRKGKEILLKNQVDDALQECATVEHVMVFTHTQAECSIQSDRDVWYHELVSDVEKVCPAELMDAEDPLFILYTSGTTGKPKGIVHTTGGYMVGAYTTTKYVFDVQDEDVFWCTADVGWITGHTYVAYGPMLNGLSQVMYEGAPHYPHKGIFWQIIQEYKVSIFYTAPTAIRMFSKWGADILKRYDLSSLRLLGSVGEPLNPEAWMWYYEHVGNSNCSIVDTWWQTETGSIMITNLPGIDDQKPGYAGKPLPGISVILLDEFGNEISDGSGLLAITKPWPSMMRGLWADNDRYISSYFKAPTFDTYYCGDAAAKDEHGNYMIIGRVDDVINVSGHRIGTMEIESAMVDHEAVAEVAVVPKPHEIKGEAIIAFVILKEHIIPDEQLKNALQQHVVKKIGAIARPDQIVFTHDVPKTRSGKIMRRLLREMVHDIPLGDMTTLANQEVVCALKDHYILQG
ncbi:MAG: acetate--CoA ligase [Candidatus Dependentiae bacterium]